MNNVKGKYQISKEQNSFGHVIADENSDLYCYCMMILNFLYGSNIDSFSLDNYYRYLEYLKIIGVDEKLIESFENLILNKDNTNPCSLVETLTNEQVCRANYRVYEKVKKKYVS